MIAHRFIGGNMDFPHIFHPGGTFHDSPPIYRWEHGFPPYSRPGEMARDGFPGINPWVKMERPSGTTWFGYIRLPTVETVG